MTSTQAHGVVAARLAPADRFAPGEGQAFVVEGHQIAVFLLRSGAVRAVSAVCPHAGGPIADGLADERVVVCPLHQNSFELATGCSAGELPPLTTYRAWIADDGWVTVETPAASAAD